MGFCEYLNMVLLLIILQLKQSFKVQLEELLDTFHFGISFSFSRSHLSSCLILE